MQNNTKVALAAPVAGLRALGCISVFKAAPIYSQGIWTELISLSFPPERDGKVSEDEKPCVPAKTTSIWLAAASLESPSPAHSTAKPEGPCEEVGPEGGPALRRALINVAMAESSRGLIGIHCSRQLVWCEMWLLKTLCQPPWKRVLAC